MRNGLDCLAWIGAIVALGTAFGSLEKAEQWRAQHERELADARRPLKPYTGPKEGDFGWYF